MAARNASGPACECGQVVFDLSGKQPGDVLCCPWCRQRYRLEEDESVTLISDTPADASTARSDRGSSSGKRRGIRNRVDEPEAESEVEVFRFDSDEDKEKVAKAPRKPGSDRARKVKAQTIEGDATERLERISRRRTRRMDSEKSAEAEVAPGPDDPLVDEWPAVKPLNLEKWVVRMFLGMIPLGTLFFMGYVIYGIQTGEREFMTYKIFGLTIRGNNPWVWFAGIVVGALVFLGIWVGYVYFFVHKRKLAEQDEERREKDSGRESSRRGARRSRRMDG